MLSLIHISQRGPGDFFGQRQHGLPALHVADLAADLALMQNAREEAEALLSADVYKRQDVDTTARNDMGETEKVSEVDATYTKDGAELNLSAHKSYTVFTCLLYTSDDSLTRLLT